MLYQQVSLYDTNFLIQVKFYKSQLNSQFQYHSKNHKSNIIGKKVQTLLKPSE